MCRTKLFVTHIFLLLFAFLNISGQSVGINPSGAPPHSGAILDVAAGDKGVLLPRSTTTSITDPTEGMVIYDTVAQQFQYYKSGQWVALLESGTYHFWWADQDGDGYGYPFNVVYAPDAPEFYVDNNDDCDDGDADIFPAGVEVCDLLDNDCDGLIDDADPDVMDMATWYFDMDCDGYGNPAIDTLACTAPPGYVDNDFDCDDNDANFHPFAPEVCDGVDNDCDFDIDDADSDLADGTNYYPDLDDDQFGDADASPTLACSPPPQHVDNNLDCDDEDANINPLVVEVCDGVDNNCDGNIDEEVFCDDGIPCTDDVCDGVGGCVFVIIPNACLIDGACYENGETQPGNECFVCNVNLSQTQWSDNVGVPCGINGTCAPGGVCVEE
jgi:hypothetical protein